MTRTCCINGCLSRTSDKERSLFGINGSRNEWISLIKNQQILDENRKLYICDLHFALNDMQKSNQKWLLRKNAVPNLLLGCIRSENSNDNLVNDIISDSSSENEIVHDIIITERTVHTSDEMTNESNENFIEETLITPLNSIFIDLNRHTKTISLTEYEKLMQLIPQVTKLKNTIGVMENVIRKKDQLLREMEMAHRRSLKHIACSSSLTTEQAEVINCLIYGIQGKQYSESVRQFCLRQQFYSQAAYESLRQFFNKNLPAKRTLQLWYTSVDGSPGINTDSLKVLREKAESYRAQNHHPLHVTLISDEMSIRKNVSWNYQKQEFVGFSTITSSTKEGENQRANHDKPLTVAKDALVFLIVGSDFKIPVAYHLLSGLHDVERAALTLEAVNLVEQTGAVVMSLTSDGLYANVAVAKLLGARFDQREPYFHSSTNPEKKIYIIFDPPHMLKLVRKHFSTCHIFHKNGKLDWNLLCILVEKQRLDNFSLFNKLTQHHIDWHQRPMNVKLAAQTISRSVADVLEQLQNDNYSDFENAQPTIDFLRNFNDVFDILNFAEGDQTDNRYKQPICEDSEETIFTFTEKIQTYIEQLEIEHNTSKGIIRKPILKSRAFMGFFGFFVDLDSLRGIYNDFIRDGPLKVFHTMIFSQDHLETFFSLIRNRQGRNDNPNAIEFASAIRKLLVCHPLTTSRDHNVITNATGILTISARSNIRSHDQINSDSNIELTEYESIEINSEELINDEMNMDSYDEHLCAYLSLCVEEKMLQSMKLSKNKSCSECMKILLNRNDAMNDALLAKKAKEHVQPSRSTFKIIVFSNAVNKKIASNDQECNFNSMREHIHRYLEINGLYTASNFEHYGENHKEKFVVQVIDTYLNMKSAKIGKKIGDEERGVFIRNRFKAMTHNAGQ